MTTKPPNPVVALSLSTECPPDCTKLSVVAALMRSMGQPRHGNVLQIFASERSGTRDR
jgi:hypothetical protein